MSPKKQKFEFLTDQKKQKCLNDIIAYFHDERGEEIGVIAAESVLDFFLAEIGDDIYKKALTDAKKLIQERYEDLNIELESLTAK